MSKLELFIKQCRAVWEAISVEPKMMDSIIDTFVKVDFDLEKVTDENIKLSTQNYINDYTIKLNKEKNENTK